MALVHKRTLEKEQKVLERCKLAVVQLHFEQTRKQESDNVKQELKDIATSLVRDKMNSKRLRFAEDEFDRFPEDEFNDKNQDPESHPKQQNTNNDLENDQEKNLINNLENIGQESPDVDESSKLNCKIAEYNPMFYRREILGLAS